jgi:hypothetical protein
MTEPSFLPRRGALALLPALALGLAACGGGSPDQPPTSDPVPSPSLYQIGPGTPVDGRVTLTLVRGQATARGVLMTNGYRVRFTATGLATSGPAPARLEVVGNVYGLPRRDVFPGTYRYVGDIGAARGDLMGNLQIGNDNLVLMRLRPAREGAADLVAADSGVVVTVSP